VILDRRGGSCRFDLRAARSVVRAGAGLVACALLAVLAPSAVRGQDQKPAPGGDVAATPALTRLDSLRQDLRLPPPPIIELVTRKRENSPGTTIGTPSAFGARWGDVFFGAGFQQRTRYTNIRDGSVVAGFGTGDPFRTIGAEFALTSFSTVRSGFGDTGGFSIKLHRLLPDLTGIALGVENAFNWGGSDAGRSVYMVGSRVFFLGDHERLLFRSINVSLGVGNGRFQSEQNALDHKHGFNVFGSGSIRVLGPASASWDWTGQDLNVGVSVLPYPKYPLVITGGFADVTHRAGDGARFILGTGYGMDFSNRAVENKPHEPKDEQ
jgi:hypothetical protein